MGRPMTQFEWDVANALGRSMDREHLLECRIARLRRDLDDARAEVAGVRERITAVAMRHGMGRGESADVVCEMLAAIGSRP